MATLNNHQETKELNGEKQINKKLNETSFSTNNLIVSKSQQQPTSKIELIPDAVSMQRVNQATTFKTLNSLDETKPANSKTMINLGSVGLNGTITNLNGTKITGKLVAVRKDGNSYTFTTNTTSNTSSTTAKTTFTLATPSKGNSSSSLITVSKSQLSLNNSNATITTSANNRTLIGTSQRIYLNKTTIEPKNSSTVLANTNQGGHSSTAAATINIQSTEIGTKMNNSKPIILQMKRKIQVLNDENQKKTARIFTIPSNTFKQQPNQTNQFIVMNRPLKSNLVTNSSNLIKATITKPITTANLAVLNRASSLSNSQIIEPSNTNATTTKINKTAANSSAIGSVTIGLKQLSSNELATANLIDTKLDAKLDTSVDSSKIKSKLDTKMSSIENEIQLNNRTTTNSIEQSAGDLSTKSEQNLGLPNLIVNHKLLVTNGVYNNNRITKVDTAKYLVIKNITKQIDDGDEIIDNLPVNLKTALDNCFVVEKDSATTTTTIENIIESTIENSFENSKTKTKEKDDASTLLEMGCNKSNCIKIEQNIEFNPNLTKNASKESSLSFGRSLTNSNDCSPPPSQFNMQM